MRTRRVSLRTISPYLGRWWFGFLLVRLARFKTPPEKARHVARAPTEPRHTDPSAERELPSSSESKIAHGFDHDVTRRLRECPFSACWVGAGRLSLKRPRDGVAVRSVVMHGLPGGRLHGSKPADAEQSQHDSSVSSPRSGVPCLAHF
eukprot:2454886-Rhodomonas_salina.5